MKNINSLAFAILIPVLCYAQSDIEPIYQSFLGGSLNEDPSGIVAVPNSRLVVAGMTSSSDIEMIGSFQSEYGGIRDGYIAIIDELGVPLFSSYIGGSDVDEISGIAMSPDSTIVFTGVTYSIDFPTLNVEGMEPNGGHSGFLAKMNLDGELLWSLFIGGNSNDEISDVAVGEYGDIFVAGRTKSTNLGTDGVHQSELINPENYSGFLGKYSNEGDKIWLTYFEGEEFVDFDKVEYLEGENSIVAYGTTRENLVAQNSQHQAQYGGGTDDCVLASFDIFSGQLNWFTYYGGEGEDIASDMSIDQEQNIFILGYTNSQSNISTVGSFQETLSGSEDIFLVKFTKEGERLWGTYFGATESDYSYGLSDIRDGTFYVSGSTKSEQGLTFGNPFLSEVALNPYESASFLSKFNVSGEVLWSTYALESYRCSQLKDIVYSNSKVYSLGNMSNPSNTSDCFPTTDNAYQSDYGGGIYDFGIFILEENHLSTPTLEIHPLDIFPNPATSYINIKNPYIGTENMELIITDISGRLVRSFSDFQSGGTLNISELRDGAYIVYGRLGERIFKQKLIVTSND